MMGKTIFIKVNYVKDLFFIHIKGTNFLYSYIQFEEHNDTFHPLIPLIIVSSLMSDI